MPVKIIRKFPDTSRTGFNFREWNKQFRTNNVIINAFVSSAYYSTHWTPLSLKCAFGGPEYYVTDKVKFAVDDSTYLILNDGTLYESFIESESRVESFTINFTREFVDEVFYSLTNSDEILTDYPEIRDRIPVNFFEKLYPSRNGVANHLLNLRETVKSGTDNSAVLDEKMHLLLEYLFSEQVNTMKQLHLQDEKKKSTRLELFKRLNLAKDYMHSNYSEKIELSDLGRISNLAPHYLLRKFKKHFGITPHRYLTKRRLEAAKDKLTLSNKSVTEICNEVGFESLSSFGALFKKHYKLPPEKFKNTFQAF
jgi:AraC family transcriptional regulator